MKNIKDKFIDVSAPELSSNIIKFETNMLQDIPSDNVLQQFHYRQINKDMI